MNESICVKEQFFVRKLLFVVIIWGDCMKIVVGVNEFNYVIIGRINKYLCVNLLDIECH